MSTALSRAAPDAYEELNSLIQTLHEQGLLELANNAVASHPQWMATIGRVVDDFIRKERLGDALAAFAEFGRLLQELHRQGLLELANNAVASYPQWMGTLGGIVDDALTKQAAGRLVGNLSVFADLISTVLSRVEPAQLNRLSVALGDSLAHVTKPGSEGGGATAPGLMGIYRLCKDESLWHALTPIIDAMKVFESRLEQEAG